MTRVSPPCLAPANASVTDLLDMSASAVEQEDKIPGGPDRAEYLTRLQRLLETIYGVDTGVDVCDFLICDGAFADRLSSMCSRAGEALLIVESDDALDVGLYLDDALLDRLSGRLDGEMLDDDCFADFCKVLEGVSHFNYVAHSAARDCAVTLMELELQAEVDKYVAARAIGGAGLQSLHRQLFDAWRPGSWLDAEQVERYRVASGFAGRYCASLERRFPAPSLAPEMLDELRSFYRQPQPDGASPDNCDIRISHWLPPRTVPQHPRQ